MLNINIQNIITFIAINLDDTNVPNIDEFISDYQQIKPIEDPIFWLSCGAFICLMSGLIFADIMKSKLIAINVIIFRILIFTMVLIFIIFYENHLRNLCVVLFCKT